MPTDAQAVRGELWREWLAMPPSMRGRVKPPACYTCGQQPIGRHRDGFPRYACSHDTRQAPRTRRHL